MPIQVKKDVHSSIFQTLIGWSKAFLVKDEFLKENI